VGLDCSVELLGQQQPAANPALVATQARADSALAQRVRPKQRTHEPCLLEGRQASLTVQLQQEHLGLQAIDVSHTHPKRGPPQLSRDVQPLEAVEHLEQSALGLGERDEWLELPVTAQRPLEFAHGVRLAQSQLAERLLGQLAQRRRSLSTSKARRQGSHGATAARLGGLARCWRVTPCP